MGKYQIVYADFPWPYTSFGTAKLPYKQMTERQICEFDWSRWVDSRACIVFAWVTGPKANVAFRAIEQWCSRHKLYYQGVPFVWIKTRKDGVPMGATGPRPRLVKSLVEWVVALSTHDKRVFPLRSENMSQYVFAEETEQVFAARGPHSRKPDVVRDRIVELLGDRPRVELFARERVAGWDSWGDELPGRARVRVRG